MVPPDSRFLVVSDIRQSSVPFKSALTEGLLGGGVFVIDGGILPTELSAYAMDTYDASGFVCVTGGCHSAVWNGLRWYLRDSGIPMSEQVNLLREAVLSSPFVDIADVNVKMPQRLRKHDITFHWIAWAQDIWHDAEQQPLRVLIDPMHGSWSSFAVRALRAIFPQVQIEAIRDLPTDKFGGVIPNSRIRASILPTCKAIKKQRASFGVAIDADSGTFTVIDNEGVPLSVEETQWLFIRHLLCDALEGEDLLHDGFCSEVLIDSAVRLGANPIQTCEDDDKFIENMQRSKALFGIASDGSMYFRGVNGWRIVLFAVSWIIDYMLCAKFTLADWRKTLPAFHITPEIYVKADGVKMDDIVDVLSKSWSSKPIKTLDGYRFSGSAAKVHLRFIEEYDQVVFRFEAKSKDGLNNIVRQSCDTLANFNNLPKQIAEQFKLITTPITLNTQDIT
jgi:phosphomannomutase/phosphoglucomutase